jgi:putative sugar O-methyltransferase
VGNDNIWKSFKQLPYYRSIVGKDDTFHAIKCIKEIQQHPEITSNLYKFARNDLIGNNYPSIVHLNGVQMSLDTIRNIHTIMHLSKSFGDLNNKTVLEIGAGWGGLAYCVKSQWKDVQYAIVDSPEHAAVADKYLKELGISDVVINPPDITPDIIIAEYSISENDDDTISDYWNNHIRNVDAFFFRWNTFSDARDRQWFDEFQKDFNITTEVEYKTRSHNTIVIGKRRVT